MAMSERGQVKMCVVHHDREAVARCVTCHRPICEECTISTTDGKFCGRECATKAADFRTSRRAPKGPSLLDTLRGYVKPIVYLVVLVVALGVVNKYVHRIPVIGGMLDKLPGLSRIEQIEDAAPE